MQFNKYILHTYILHTYILVHIIIDDQDDSAGLRGSMICTTFFVLVFSLFFRSEGI